MNYRLTRRAKADIQNIYRYTAEQFGETQSELYLGGFDYIFDLLTDSPTLGKPFEENVRRYLYREHYVYFEIESEDVIILQIRNTCMNLPSQKE